VLPILGVVSGQHSCSDAETSVWVATRIRTPWSAVVPTSIQSCIRLFRLALWKAVYTVKAFLTSCCNLQLIDALYQNTGARVRVGKKLSKRFQTSSVNVRQGCILASAFFNMRCHWLDIAAHVHEARNGIKVRTSNFTDHVYADDINSFCSIGIWRASVRYVVQLYWGRSWSKHAAFENSNYLLFYHKWKTHVSENTIDVTVWCNTELIIRLKLGLPHRPRAT